ncbi:MAG: hypothetical protein IPM39_13000 [Chloroflexi bacterium]|nr:hypothetical protein [Chloroflexota bacterium]
MQASAINQYLLLSLDPSVTAVAYVQWDGADATENIDPTGLGIVDFTDTGLNDGVLVRIINSDGLPVEITIRFYSDASNWAESQTFQTTVSTGQVVDLFIPLQIW